MKKLLLLLLPSCTFYAHHIKQAPYAYCHTDSSITYQISHVDSVRQVEQDPIVYELTYSNGEKELFNGMCYIPKVESY